MPPKTIAVDLGPSRQASMNPNPFEKLSLCRPLLRALSEEGYEKPTDIQRETIPKVLAGNDLLATAQTGTGKTAAFALPILQRLDERRTGGARFIRVLVLTPTRELALQVASSFRCYGRHLKSRAAVILGGVPASPQIKALKKNPDIVVATPGRLLDLFGQGYVRLDRVEALVLDEADRMLDMGFVDDVRRIVSKLPYDRQTLFFSATLSWEIAELASDMLRNPSEVAVTPAASVSGSIAQKVFFVQQMHKRDLLADILKGENVERALVFTRTKHRANRISRQLSREGISADTIHSNKSQGQRQRALSAFHRGRIKVLVGTDVVARGIDVEGISHVINYELPENPKSYVHRIGRTARADAIGTALSFCAAEEVALLREIEKLTKCEITPDEDHAFHCATTAELRDRDLARSQPRQKGPPFGRRRRLIKPRAR
jgi:ATP-dependent RNA helicase RhlE